MKVASYLDEGVREELVCSSNPLGQLDQPEVRQLQQSLLPYAGSTEFQPGTAVDTIDSEKLVGDKAGKL